MREFRNTGYFVLPNGEILGKTKKLKMTTTPYGYNSVCLYFAGKGKTFLSHRMVAELYVENEENKCCVNHKDGNKKNNDYKNLEWVTIKENVNHFLTKISQRKHEEHPNSKLKFSDMLLIHNQYKNSGIYQKDIAKNYNVDISTVQRAIRIIENYKEVR